MLVAVAALAAPAGAKTVKPCKLVKASEIAAEFEATVSDPQPGTKTAATVECTWDVAAGSSLPAGSVTVRVMFVGAKAAYDGLKTEAGFAPVAGLEKSLYQESTGALMVLDGKSLVTVQGVFLATSPIRAVDVQEQLIPLMELATKRV